MASLDKKAESVDIGARKARDEMMSTLIQLSQEEIKGERPVVGYTRSGKKIYQSPAEPNHPPMNRTGNLRRSIRGEKARLGFADYYAKVGPEMVYARRVELGGGNWPSGLKFPYMTPAFQKFQRVAGAIARKNLIH